ncbi:hypothetical protein KKC59_00610 [bacterium]|nr:hypothetical protein [bacterium]
MKKGFVKEIILSFVLFFCVIIVAYPYLQKRRELLLNTKIQMATSELNSYINKEGVIEDKEYLKKLLFEKESFEKKLNELTEKVLAKDEESVLSVDGLAFKEKYHALKKMLERKAESNGVKIVQNLGMGEALPEKEQVVVFFRRLNLVKILLSVLIDNKVSEIYNVKVFDPIEVIGDDQAEDICVFIPINIGFSCDTKAFIKALNEINNLNQLVFISNMEIKKVEDQLEVNIIFNTPYCV